MPKCHWCGEELEFIPNKDGFIEAINNSTRKNLMAQMTIVHYLTLQSEQSSEPELSTSTI